MTTPERPSLADTLARIDAAIAERAAKLDAQPPCLRCARKSLIDSPYCAYHLPCPIDQARDEATAEVLRIVQHDFARHEREYLYGKPAELLPELERRLLDAAVKDVTGPDEPPVFATVNEARAEAGLPPIGPASASAVQLPPRPGWLARALRRLFT